MMMVEGGDAGLGAFRSDCVSVLTELKLRHKQLAAKRRWLMGLPLSDSEDKVFQGKEFWDRSVVPESLLREDDLFYETVKTHVRRHNTDRESELVVRNFKSFDREATNRLLCQLNFLTNKGLHHVAVVAARGSQQFHCTRQGMKKMIRQTVRNLSKDEEDMQWRTEICQHLYELLHDPQFVRGNVPRYLDVRPQSTRMAAMKVIDRLEDFPTSVLIAMNRKLRGLGGKVPRLTSKESTPMKGKLIHQMRRICYKMLSELDDRAQLQDHLAKALAVAVLYLRLAPESESPASDFHQFTPEIRVLQQQILKAIELLKAKRFPVLKKLQALLHPGSDVPKMRLRSAIFGCLAEYLFECSDMNTIPDSLIKSLAIINEGNAIAAFSSSSEGNPRFYDEKEEVDSILAISALLKQIVLDLLPEMDYAADFSDAYADETDESDEEDGISHSMDNCVDVKSSHNEGYYTEYANPLAEGQGTSFVISCDPSPSRMDSESGSPHSTHDTAPRCGPSVGIYTGMDYSGPTAGDFLDGERNKDDCDGKKIFRNFYLAIQEACDGTSLLVSNIVDFMLKEIAEDRRLDLDEDPFSDNVGKSSGKGKKRSIEEENERDYEDGTLVFRVIEHQLPNHQDRVKQRLKALMES
ncbi:hypothetical protein MLD38_027380 [Melastoma candidum]|uniref:Uncharacterized protein n=1 Tax=Melastoma candidum TaxID=119954 RepID=A0ACB9P369_9MYRT|nr:hypothetical protein MLD38_027380 [Melastoma candidum]